MATLTPKAPASTGAGAPGARRRRSGACSRRVPRPPAARSSVQRAVPGLRDGVFAFPVVYSVYIAFHDFFFAAPGAEVDRPFVGLDN